MQLESYGKNALNEHKFEKSSDEGLSHNEENQLGMKNIIVSPI